MYVVVDDVSVNPDPETNSLSIETCLSVSALFGGRVLYGCTRLHDPGNTVRKNQATAGRHNLEGIVCGKNSPIRGYQRCWYVVVSLDVVIVCPI
jgi:hypothetical protein